MNRRTILSRIRKNPNNLFVLVLSHFHESFVPISLTAITFCKASTSFQFTLPALSPNYQCLLISLA
ncbi:uncharacterized protein BYT42DRAFT_567583 [Radiomyces spectabilis]|uniref:uncharacterized protein n=1 Tax=Radiomyces spectabilis TaxID=64574 RepID=UPI00221F2902|nr:uncharacterized protein BYT42DRAFT_567583 [Radiomyces spectabilis]KAI8379120.1 hypothetical protein BYT42DRAFT_567583 [Radiomyces spectabilis]